MAALAGEASPLAAAAARRAELAADRHKFEQMLKNLQARDPLTEKCIVCSSSRFRSNTPQVHVWRQRHSA